LHHKVDDAYRVEPRRGWLLNADRPGRNGTGQAEAPPTVGVNGQVVATEADQNDEGDDQEVLDRWPKIDPHAFYGLAGKIVCLVEPQTEADPIAVLLQFLIAFGNMIGRSAHFRVGPTRHYTNINGVFVGLTAIGRKGTSWDLAKWILGWFDQEWTERRIQSGLVSGEGLIYHVRDEALEARKDNPGKGSTQNEDGVHADQVVGFTATCGKRVETVVVDSGVSDKRLLVVETELSRTLKAMNREGNTLSDVVRQAWDSGNLKTLGKNRPVAATNAHISIIGHSTQADIRKHLTETDSANGFANRFLWAAVRRSKELPDGGNFDAIDWTEVKKEMEVVIRFAREHGEIQRDPTANQLWHQIYSELSAGKAGLVGAILSRAEPQVMRLACLYALLDHSPVIGVKHLTAALAVWNYCEQSARLIFRDALGNPDAEKLLQALQNAPEGLTRKEVTAVFAKNKLRAEIAFLLSELLTQGLIHQTTVLSERGRRPERWHAGRGKNTSGATH
jgi:hypothetical protein